MSSPFKLYNKLERTYELCSKKNLFVNLKLYYETLGQDPYDTLPVTFLIKGSVDDQSFLEFQDYYVKHEDDATNMWIIKPGEDSNRGCGIQVAKGFKDIEDIIERSNQFSRRTNIIQRYIHKPLLY